MHATLQDGSKGSTDDQLNGLVDGLTGLIDGYMGAKWNNSTAMDFQWAHGVHLLEHIVQKGG